MWHLDKKRDRGSSDRWDRPSAGRRLQARASGERSDRVHRYVAIAILLMALAGTGTALVLGFRHLRDWLFATNPRYTITASGLDLHSSGRLSPLHLKEFAGVAEGQNLFALDLNQIRARLLSVPRIKSAEVQRVPPGTLRVRVSERAAIARLVAAPRMVFTVDSEGVILAPARSTDALPLIEGLQDNGLSPGTQVTAAAFLDGLEALQLSRNSGWPSSVSLIRVGVAHPEYVDLQLSDGTRVLMGRMEMDRRFRILGDILKNSRRRSERTALIDLTMDRNIPVRLAES